MARLIAAVTSCPGCANCSSTQTSTCAIPTAPAACSFSYRNANLGAFHRADAAGYVFWSERARDRRLQPQVAARLACALDRWSRLAEPHAALRVRRSAVAAKADLSNDVREVVQRALHSNLLSGLDEINHQRLRADQIC